MSPLRFYFLICLFWGSCAFSQQMYLPLPDGSSLKIRDGETTEQAWLRASQMYPEAFGFKKLRPGQKYDVDYFNSCKLSAAKSTVGQLAMISAIQACEYKAIPKKCRAFSVNKDTLGNETGADRVKCVEQCNNANPYSKSLGECSKG